MKAAFFKEHGGADKIEYGEMPRPQPGANEVLIRVHACSINHLDIWVRKGLPAYPVALPHILGADISGEIAEVPSSGLPPDFKAGSPVFVAPGISCWNCAECLSGHDNQCSSYRIMGSKTNGGYAEFAAVPIRNIFPKPEHLSYEEAASFPLTFLTAWHMLITRAQLKPGETVLVLGAGAGVAVAAIQIAKAAGATIIAVSSSDEKLALAKNFGADYGINGQREDFAKVTREITNRKGADIVFEHIGPDTWEKSVRSLAVRGRIVTCGNTSGPFVNLDLRMLFSKDQSILGSKMGTREELEKILAMLNQKKLKPIVGKVFPLSEAREAHEYLEQKSQFGKVVLKID